MNPSFCFVAGTTVLTTLGKKAIETIQVGDTIPCVDHITGETTEKKVISTTVNKLNRLIELDIDGEIIQCTKTHPFQVKGKGWVDACNLNPEDIVYTKDWGTATVQSVDLLELDEPVEVFNFEVEDCHTYFVGNIYILVHNSDCSVNQMNRQIKKGQAPKEIKRIDPPQTSVPNSKIHAHFQDGTSLNIDGTIHDISHGLPKLTKQTSEWLIKHGWKL